MNNEQMGKVIEALAHTAYLVHNKAQNPKVIDPETLWRNSARLRELWGGIVLGIIQGASTAAEVAAGKPQPGMPLPGLGMPLGASLPVLGPASALPSVLDEPSVQAMAAPYPPHKPPEGKTMTPHPNKTRAPELPYQPDPNKRGFTPR